MKINIGKLFRQLLEGEKPVEILIADTRAELDRAKAKVHARIVQQSGGPDADQVKTVDDAFAELEQFLLGEEKKVLG